MLSQYGIGKKLGNSKRISQNFQIFKALKMFQFSDQDMVTLKWSSLETDQDSKCSAHENWKYLYSSIYKCLFSCQYYTIKHSLLKKRWKTSINEKNKLKI